MSSASRHCKLLFPQWDSLEREGYQCCVGSLSPTILQKPIADQVRHVAQSCPGKAFDDADIDRVRTALVAQATTQGTKNMMANMNRNVYWYSPYTWF
jgi:hypothetical protein